MTDYINILKKGAIFIFKGVTMENIIYNGVSGVFISNDEFNYIKETITANRELMQSLIKEIAKGNPNIYNSLSDLD